MRLFDWIRKQLHKLPSGKNRGWDQHVLYGRWYVTYVDGGDKTHPMFYDTAKEYADRYDGVVHYAGTRRVDEKDNSCDCS